MKRLIKVGIDNYIPQLTSNNKKAISEIKKS